MNKKEDEKQTFCFDLDGTLCSQRHLDYENAEPFNDRIKKVNELYDEGNTIIIDTARGSKNAKEKHWVHITKKQIDGWGLKYHKLRAGLKISADIYVDDRAIQSDTFFKII